MRYAASAIVTALLACCSTTLAGEAPRGSDALSWDRLPPLPDPEGFAGSFVGVSGDALVVAGGANFPEGRPWDGATKVWDDRIFVLPDPEGEWTTDFRLPRPLAYGASVTTEDGIVCMGGSDAERHYRDVFLLRWADNRIQITGLPPMPEAAAYFCAARIGQTIYVAGGRAAPDSPKALDAFWALDLSKQPRTLSTDELAVLELLWKVGPLTGADMVSRRYPSASIADHAEGMVLLNRMQSQGYVRQVRIGGAVHFVATMDRAAFADKWLMWRELEPWPGTARMYAVAAVQGGSFFLVGGVALDPNQEGDDKRVFLNDCCCYDPETQQWSQIASIPRFAAAAPTPAIPLGQSHFAIVGGDDGANAFRVAELKDKHPGFPADVLSYDVVTDTWITAGRFPKDAAAGLWPPVTANTTVWHDRYVIPGGESRPGIRTPQVFWAEPLTITRGFGLADYAVLAVYLAALVAMGVYFSRREKTTGDFFLGGRRIPWWAAGLSIFGTQLSAITFMAIPAKSFATDWVFFLFNMMIVVMAPVVVFLYLPFYRRLEVTSAYEYLEKRFNKATRLLGSAAFVLFQLGRMGVVLFLPALALSTVTGINVYSCIILMGVLATLYTVLGGIEAVVWTDVLQVVVLMGGAILSLGIIAVKLAGADGGLGAALAMIGDADKLRLADFDWTAARPVVWVIVVGGVGQILVSYTGDQTVIQRYLTTADEKAAAHSIWTNAALTIPAGLIFFAVGTALWAFYKTRPEMLNPTGRTDDIFPWFIAQQLPAGVAGLVIAGLFAAAMSSLDSSMNSMATAITTDYYRWFRPAASDRHLLAVARWLTVLLGILGTGSAVVMAILNSPSMWDQYMKIVGLFGGGLAGLFALGIFTRRTHAAGALTGFLASALVLYWVAAHDIVNGVLYAAVGLATCLLVGYAASLVIPSPRHDLAGLTLFTLSRRMPRHADTERGQS